MKTLIAEDDFASRRVLLRFLEEHGDCDVTVDGREAVEAFEMALENGEGYDLLCLDIMISVEHRHHDIQTKKATTFFVWIS